MTTEWDSNSTPAIDAEETSRLSSEGLLGYDTDNIQDAKQIDRAFGRRDMLARCFTIAWIIATAGCILLAFVFGRNVGFDKTRDCVDTVWDDVLDNLRFKQQVFNPRFIGPPSEFMGDPNPELDKRWYDISKMYNFGVDYTTISRINKTKGIVEYPGTGKYQASLMTFHQLHCLNYIRMYTNQSYYEKFDYDMIWESSEKRQEHKDHCVEMVRQALMCSPDLNIYTYHWVSYAELPEADLFTTHRQCIDWNYFYDWAKRTTMKAGQPRKPEGADVAH